MGYLKAVIAVKQKYKLATRKLQLFLAKKDDMWLDGIGKSCKELSYSGYQQFCSPNLWYLVDSINPTTIPGFPIHKCSVLLASTPRRDCIGEFKKLVPTPDIFYMPVWTKGELALIAPLYPDEAAIWEHRLECLGGVPRFVLQDIQTDLQTLLMLACNDCSLDDCTMLVSIHSMINSKTKIIQTLIHIHSEAPYREYKVAYASKLAMQMITRMKWQPDCMEMQNLLSSCDGNALTQSLCGYIFETHTMDLLGQDGTFVYRKLQSGAEMRKRDTIKRKQGTHYSEDEETIDIPASLQPRQIVKCVEIGQSPDQLYVPRISNFAVIDAWIPNFGVFQMTVGRKHNIEGGAADDLVKLGPNGNWLYFLLPPLNYKTFTSNYRTVCNPYPIS